MDQYSFEITETSMRIVTVTADNLAEAKLKVEEQYTSGDIVLDSSDFIDYSIDPVV